MDRVSSKTEEHQPATCAVFEPRLLVSWHPHSTIFVAVQFSFENGKFLSTYQKGVLPDGVDSAFTVGIEPPSAEESSCSQYSYTPEEWGLALDVPASGLPAIPDPGTGTIDSYCREYFVLLEDGQPAEESFNGLVYDCRKRAWYFNTKVSQASAWTSFFSTEPPTLLPMLFARLFPTPTRHSSKQHALEWG